MEANAPCSTHWIELQPGFVLRFQRQCLSEPTQLQTVRKDCRERKTTGIIIPISWTARNGAGFWVLAILTCHLFQGSALGLVVFLILLGRQWVDCGRWTAASCREMIKKKKLQTNPAWKEQGVVKSSFALQKGSVLTQEQVSKGFLWSSLGAPRTEVLPKCFSPPP